MSYWFERLLEETDESDFYDRKIAIYPAGYGKRTRCYLWPCVQLARDDHPDPHS